LRSTALASIPVGVIVERRKARSPWIDYLWRPVSVLVGTPAANPGTVLNENSEAVLFYAGAATIELYRTETTYYRDNLTSSAPSLWIALRPTASELPYEVLTVTADPAEGEALTDAGNNVVEAVPMPQAIIETISSPNIMSNDPSSNAVAHRPNRRRADPQSPRRTTDDRAGQFPVALGAAQTRG
jgi:Protein of unknown function (DUF3305)